MGRRVLRRGSKKGLSRRHLEGRNTPFLKYDPLGVHPMYVCGGGAGVTRAFLKYRAIWGH